MADHAESNPHGTDMVPDLTGVDVTMVAREMPPVVGGVERQVSEIAAALSRAGARITVVTGTPGATPIGGVRIRARPPRLRGRGLYLGWMLGTALLRGRRGRRHVVISARTSAESACLALLAPAARRPLCVSLTGGTPAGSELLAQRRQWARRAIVGRASAAVAHAGVFLDELRDQGFRGDAVVIPTIAVAATGTCAATTCTAPLVWVGRDDPVKNLGALRAIVDECNRRFSYSGPPALLIADRRPSEVPAGAQVHIGCPSPRTHLGACGVFLLTSLIEGQSNAMAEAALEGVPSVAYATGGTPELVRSLDCGETLPLWSSAEEMARAVQRVDHRFRDPLERQALRERAHQRFVIGAPEAWVRLVGRLADR